MDSSSRTFVLVHGAWHGGWCYGRVASRLIKAGHRVITPTLTGLGERAHLMNAAINLRTHVDDVVNVIRWEDLSDVVLLGHSYGGIVVSEVVERVPAAIASLVYLDAFVPENGKSLLDHAPEERRAAFAAAAQQSGGLSITPIRAAASNVNEKDRAWVDAKCVPHPYATLTDKVTLTGARERVKKKAYVRAGQYPQPAFQAWYEKFKADPSWRTYELPCGHDIMVDLPDRLAEILVEVA
jgi:pimeloyl-ACP methyl ester carboxylesterase